MNLVDATTRKIALDAALDAVVTPQAMLRKLKTATRFAADWSVGESTEIQMRIEPKGYACLAQGMDRTDEPSDVIRPDPPRAMDSVVVPIALHVRSTDQRLDASLSGFISAHAAHAAKWNGSLELHASALVEAIEKRGQKAMYPTPAGQLAVLSFQLSLPRGEGPPTQLAFTSYIRRADAPPLPTEGELDFNRISCVVVPASMERREVDLTSKG